MSMEIIQSAATELLVNVALAVLALAGAYAVYYIRLGTSKLKAQTAQIEDASTRKVLDDALEDVANLTTLSVGAMEQTTAKALREAVKGGKASREELVALGKQLSLIHISSAYRSGSRPARSAPRRSDGGRRSRPPMNGGSGPRLLVSLPCLRLLSIC